MAGPPSPRPAQRQLALDAFRGLLVVSLLAVDNPGRPDGTLAWLHHAPWGGLPTLADLVMPWFTLVLGIAMAFWIPRGIARAGVWRPRRTRPLWRALLGAGVVVLLVPAVQGLLGRWIWAALIGLALCLQQVVWDLPKGEFWCRVLRRSWTLMVLGCLIGSSAGTHLGIGRCGLQLLALVTLAGALIYHFAWRHRAWWALGLLLAHWALLRFVPHPDTGAAVFTQDQDLLRWLDQHVFGSQLRGCVAVLPATACALIGSLAGEVLRAPTLVGRERTLPIAAAGALLTVLGWLWHHDLPFARDAWTAPYVLFAAGLGLLLFAAMAEGIDVLGHRRWCAPLAVFGRNALAATAGAILLRNHTLDEWPATLRTGATGPVRQLLVDGLCDLLGPLPGSLAWSALWLAAVWLGCRWLDRRGWHWQA